MSKTTNLPLSIREQELVKNELRVVIESSDWTDTIFLTSGGPFAAAFATTVCSFVAWKHTFRAFGLVKYNHGRIMTLLPSFVSGISAGSLHTVFVQGGLFDNFRSENYLNYATRSFLIHQLSAGLGFVLSTGGTFVAASTIYLVSIHPQFYKMRHLKPALSMVSNKINISYRPFFKTLGFTSISMFMVGLAEYHQTRKALAKLNRKSLYLKESDDY